MIPVEPYLEKDGTHLLRKQMAEAGTETGPREQRHYSGQGTVLVATTR